MADTTTVTPTVTAADYHPDHPMSIGWLIWALHERLAAIEVKLGLSTSDKPTPTATTAKTVATGPVQANEADVTAALRKFEDVLHLPHSA